MVYNQLHHFFFLLHGILWMKMTKLTIDVLLNWHRILLWLIGSTENEWIVQILIVLLHMYGTGMFNHESCLFWEPPIAWAWKSMTMLVFVDRNVHYSLFSPSKSLSASSDFDSDESSIIFAFDLQELFRYRANKWLYI